MVVLCKGRSLINHGVRESIVLGVTTGRARVIEREGVRDGTINIVFASILRTFAERYAASFQANLHQGEKVPNLSDLFRGSPFLRPRLRARRSSCFILFSPLCLVAISKVRPWETLTRIAFPELHGGLSLSKVLSKRKNILMWFYTKR